MNEKTKWIFLQGGLLYGGSMTVIISTLRWIEKKPPAFDSYSALFAMCILLGVVWGYLTQKLDKSFKVEKFITTLPKLVKSLLLLIFTLFIYGIIYHFLIIPNKLDDTLTTTVVFLTLMFITIFFQSKYIIKDDQS